MLLRPNQYNLLFFIGMDFVFFALLMLKMIRFVDYLYIRSKRMLYFVICKCIDLDVEF